MRKTFIRSIVTICASIGSVGAVQAQLGHSKEYVEPPGWSVGMNVGLLDLWGDVGTQSVIDHYANSQYWDKPHFMGGVFVRYTAHPAIAFRLGVNYGTLYANDDWNKQKAESASSVEDDAFQRYVRNLHVRANTWEGNFLIEFNPLRMSLDSRAARKRFQPYLLAGFAYFHFKPTAKYIDRDGNDRGYVNLYDLHIEGDGLPPEVYPDAPAKYDLWQMAVPLGLGVKWDIGKQLVLGIEYMYRMTFTDYLDNVSKNYLPPWFYDGLPPEKAYLAQQMADRSWLILGENHNVPRGGMRGNPSVNDSYSTFGVTLMFKIPSRKTPWWY